MLVKRAIIFTHFQAILINVLSFELKYILILYQDSLTRTPSLASENGIFRPRSTFASVGSIGSIVSVKQARPVSAAAQPVTFTVPVSKERYAGNKKWFQFTRMNYRKPQ